MLVTTIQPPSPSPSPSTARTPLREQPLDVNPSSSRGGQLHPFGDGLPALTQRQLSYRIDRLARVFHLNGDDTEDLREALVLEVYRAMVRYDPAISKATTFARGVMDVWYLQMCKDLRKRRELQRRHQSLPEPGSETYSFIARRPQPEAEVGLRMDLAEALGRLPRDLRVLVEELQTKTIPEIAKQRRVHRGTINRMVWRLRKCLAKVDPSIN